mgnify:FL=1
MKQFAIPLPKRAYNIITTYKNNREREFAFVKYFSLESSANEYCDYRERNPKVLSCYFELKKLDSDILRETNGNILRPIKGKLNYYIDKKGYKYYIKDGIKIKSKQPI